jgi:hypothetical protein
MSSKYLDTARTAADCNADLTSEDIIALAAIAQAEAAERQADAMETLTLNTERIAASLETIAKCVTPSKNGVPALSINEEYLEWRSNL